MTLLLLVAGLHAATDTITLDVSTALARGLEVSPALEGSRQRVSAAGARAQQATAWPNPELSIAAENVGQSRTFTGIDGVDGLEAQAVVRLHLPVGPERAGAIAAGRATEQAAVARSELMNLAVGTEILTAMGSVVRDQMLVASARDEAAALSEIADMLALQAERGRGSEGDAARSRLAAGLARTALARRESGLARVSADLSRRLGYGPGTIIRLETASCAEPVSTSPRAVGTPDPQELRLAEAEVEAARAAVELARGARLPDVAPDVGVRRSGGNTGLYLGLSTTLPLFDRGSARIGAAMADEVAATADRRDAEERWAAAHAAALEVLGSLERAGSWFDDEWRESLDRTVVAAEARYRLGEGTLVELLDSRRARLGALDDYYTWLSEWWIARLEVERLEGRLAKPEIICITPILEGL